MSLQRLLDRTVTLVPMVLPANADRYGNRERVEGTPIPNVRCRRAQISAVENVLNRDQQTTEFIYYFEAGVPVTGRYEIIDGIDRLRVVGEPVRAQRAKKVHHVEIRAERVEG